MQRTLSLVCAVLVAVQGIEVSAADRMLEGMEDLVRSDGPKDDLNGDGIPDMSDAVWFLVHLFLGGPEPLPLSLDPKFQARLILPEPADCGPATPTPWTAEEALALPIPLGHIKAARDRFGRWYVAGGVTGRPPNNPKQERVWRFDELAMAWTEVARLSGPRYAYAMAVDYLGRIYVIGGADGVALLRSVERYDPRTDTWTFVSPLPAALVIPGAVADASGRFLYVCGGEGDEAAVPLNTVLRYDVCNDTWDEVAPMLYPRNYHRVVRGADGLIYALGGGNPGSPTGSTVERYDPRTGTWTELAPMIVHPHQIGAAVADECGFVYVMGGWNPGYSDTVERYDPRLDRWEELAPLTQAKNVMAALFSESGRVYVIGGDAGTVAQSTVEWIEGCVAAP